MLPAMTITEVSAPYSKPRGGIDNLTNGLFHILASGWKALSVSSNLVNGSEMRTLIKDRYTRSNSFNLSVKNRETHN